MSQKNILMLAICVGLATVSPVVAQAAQKAPKAVKTIQVSPGKGMTPQNEANESDMAKTVILKIAAAQKSLEADKPELAQAQLVEAQVLLEEIKLNEPTANIIEKVHTARTNLEKSEQVPVTLIPLDAELVSFETITPVPTAKHHLLLAKKSLANQDNKTASQELLQVENNLIYAEAALPVNRTYQDVVGAQYMLTKNKISAAKKMLQDSQQHIVLLETDTKTSETIKTNTAKQ